MGGYFWTVSEERETFTSVIRNCDVKDVVLGKAVVDLICFHLRAKSEFGKLIFFLAFCDVQILPGGWWNVDMKIIDSLQYTFYVETWLINIL